MSLTEIQNVLQKVCAPLAVLTNAFLINLILYCSPKSLGVYKYLMIYISIFEIVYALLDIIAAPDMYSYDTVFIVIFRIENVFVPKWATSFVFTTFCSMFGTSQVMFTLHFLYRYLVIIGSDLVKITNFWKAAGWFVTPAFVGVFWGFLLVTTLSENEFTYEKLKFSYLPLHNIDADSVYLIGPNYFMRNSDGEEEYNWRVISGMAIMMTIINSSILAIVSFAVLTYRKIGSLIDAMSSSKQYRTLQMELLNALVGQALIPAFLMLGPSCAVFIAPFFHLGSVFPGGVLGITICLYPVFDPLPTMFIMKNYRDAILKPFLKCCKNEEQPLPPTHGLRAL